MEKIKIGIIICDRYRSCAGGKCLRAFHNREGAFSVYPNNDLELAAFTTCGGCPGGNIEYAPEEMKKTCADVGVYSPVPVVKKAVKEVSDRFLSIFDAPPGISCPFIATVEQADYVVLVTEPTPFGLNDLKLSVETLRQLHKSFGVIVNRAGLGNREVFTWLEETKIPLLMEIPFDREIARIYSEGLLLVEEMPAYQLPFWKLLETIEKLARG